MPGQVPRAAGGLAPGAGGPPPDDPGRGPSRTLLSRFGRARGGVAALEFALVAPFLIALFMGGFEMTRYLNTLRKLTSAANSVAQMMAQNISGTVNANDIGFAMDSTMVTFPDVLSDSYSKGVSWTSDIGVNISSIAFTPTVAGCTSSCTYTAQLVWSGGANQRPCYTNFTPVANTQAWSKTTLPTDVFGPGSLIAVDVVYSYTPFVATNMFGTMTIHRSAYLQPRYVKTVKFDSSSGGNVAVCN